MSASTAVKQLRSAARIILVGAPGVGKGTQSERLIKRYPQLASIATGDLLRDNVKNNTPLGKHGRLSHDFTFHCNKTSTDMCIVTQANKPTPTCAPAN